MRAELLIRCNTQTQSLEQMTYSGKKEKKITAQARETPHKARSLDIGTLMGALGMCRLSALESDLITAKYQDTTPQALEKNTAKVITTHWKGPPLDIEKATKLILAEILYHHICILCEGSGKRMITQEDTHYLENGHKVGKIVKCGRCQGSGKKMPTEHGRAQFLKIHHEIWKRKYAVPFRQLHYILSDIISRAEGQFSKKMA